MKEKAVNVNKRISGYENIKFFLIFLVVLGHVLENEYSFEHSEIRSAFLWIYFFHMPAFIFLSGLMSNIDKAINWKRVVSFIVLGYAYKILNTLVIGVGTGEWVFILLRENGIPWFMFAMAVYPVIAHMTKNIKKSIVICGTIALGLVIGFDKELMDGTLVLGRMIVYLPFYMVGCYCDSQRLISFCKAKKIKAAAIIVVIVYTIVVFWQIDIVYGLRHIITGKNAYSEWAIAHGAMFMRLICYLGAFVLILALISLIPNRDIPFITVAGGRTISVYFWHRNILRILQYAGFFSFINETLGCEMWCAIVISLTLTVVLSLKFCSIPINYIMKGMYK